MFIDFNEFIKNTEEVVKEVCSFVGAEPDLYNHRPQPPGMKVVLTLPSPPLSTLQQVMSHAVRKSQAMSHAVCPQCMPQYEQAIL